MEEWRTIWIVEGRTPEGWMATVEVGVTGEQVAVRAPETVLLDAEGLTSLARSLGEAIDQLDQQ